MRYFESLVTTTQEYTFRIVEDVPEVGFCFIVNSKSGEYIPSIYKDTIQACQDLALEMYKIPINAWRSEGKYLESLVATTKKYTLRIVEDLPEIGFYLYSFDKDGKPIRDDLQNTIQDCKEIALEMYGVPVDVWREDVKEDSI